jgi:hypothetical protein
VQLTRIPRRQVEGGVHGPDDDHLLGEQVALPHQFGPGLQPRPGGVVALGRHQFGDDLEHLVPADAAGRRDRGHGALAVHHRSHPFGQVPRRHEVDQHGVEPAEGWSGQARAVEQGIDVSADLVHGRIDGVGLAQVGLVEAGHLDRRLLQVQDVHVGPQFNQVVHHGGTHAGPTPRR